MKTLKEISGKKGKDFKGSKTSQLEFNPPIKVEQSGMHEGTEALVEADIDKWISEAISLDDLLYMFEGDLSDLDEHGYLLEDLSQGQRNRKRMSFRRHRARIAVARRRSMRRRASTQKVMARARRMAISRMKTKLANGRAPGSLSTSEKNRVERLVKRRRLAVNRSQRKLVRTVRAVERKRLNNGYEVQLDNLNQLYEAFFNISDVVNEVQ